MKFINTTIEVGADRPFELLHISDIHLTYADERDDERKLQLAADRLKYFPDAEKNLAEAVADSRLTGAMMVSTGDLIDFVSHANVDAARKFIEDTDCFFAAGNHEFSLYVGEAWEDEAYRNQSLDFVQSAFKNDIRFDSRIVNGVNLVAIDNGYYLFDQYQLNALKAECAKGLPVILLMHVPLHEDELCHDLMNVRGEPCSYLMNSPDSLIDTYSEHRARQQRADDVTREAYAYIKSVPVIKAIIAGHVHGRCYESKLTKKLTQYIVDTETARRITII